MMACENFTCKEYKTTCMSCENTGCLCNPCCKKCKYYKNTCNGSYKEHLK